MTFSQEESVPKQEHDQTIGNRMGKHTEYKYYHLNAIYYPETVDLGFI